MSSVPRENSFLCSIVATTSAITASTEAARSLWLLFGSCCQITIVRPFDATPTENFIVRAIWLAREGPLDDYVRLLAHLAKSSARSASRRYSPGAIDDAQRLFGGKEFRHILDGELAEEYLQQSIAVERGLEQKDRRGVAE